MPLRLGFIVMLIGIYIAGMELSAHHAPTWKIAALMGVVFIGLVIAMYLRVLPALLALPILAIALASIAGMDWKDILSKVVEDGGMRLKTAIFAAILGSILAQVVEKTGIAQTAIKKTAELGGDRPVVLAIVLTIVIAILFTVLGGLGAVIMVATIVIPIMLSLGLRPLYVGCLFLLAMSLGGAFNLTNWELYKTTLGMTNAQIGAFAWPFAGLMLTATFIFLGVEGKRMGKARFKATLAEPEIRHEFVPWYALLTPIVPLIPVLCFILIPKIYAKPAVVQASMLQEGTRIQIGIVQKDAVGLPNAIATLTAEQPTLKLPAGHYLAWVTPPKQAKPDAAAAPADGKVTTSLPVKPSGGAGKVQPAPPSVPLVVPTVLDLTTWSTADLQVIEDPASHAPAITTAGAVPTTYDFPISVALLLGIIYGAVTTWKKGQSTVQLVTKSAFDGVAAVGPALVLMLGIGMVFIATTSPEVKGIIGPLVKMVVPQAAKGGAGIMVHYVILFTILAPLALYRGPMNLYGMGAGLVGLLNGVMPAGAIMGAFMSVGMIQGVCDPTNTHNVWIANYTGTDVQDILKRTLPYMWGLAVIGLMLSAAIYYHAH